MAWLGDLPAGVGDSTLQALWFQRVNGAHRVLLWPLHVSQAQRKSLGSLGGNGPLLVLGALWMGVAVEGPSGALRLSPGAH